MTTNKNSQSVTMHLFLVERSDSRPAGYDEYSGGVVRAANAREAKEAIRALQTRYTNGGYDQEPTTRLSDWTARSIPTDGKPEVILTDFAAG